MKPEFTERLFVEGLYNESLKKDLISEEILRVDKLTGDASTRRYYRIESSEKSYVVCLDDPTCLDSEKNEFLEVQRILNENRIRVPQLYDYNLKKGYFLEEDLGDCTLLKYIGLESSIEKVELEYEKAVESLMRMQSIDVSKYSDYSFSKMAFDEKKLSQEINFTKKYFIEEFLGHQLSEEESLSLSLEFKKITKKITKKKMVFTHRDFHSRNIMIKSGEQVIIDFQDARLGIPQYDLVSLLDDCYYLVNEKSKYRLKAYYYENFIKPRKLQDSPGEFDMHYDLMAVQRLYKAIGSFTYIYKTRGDYRYLKYVGFAFEKLKTILEKHGELFTLRKILGRIYYEY